MKILLFLVTGIILFTTGASAQSKASINVGIQYFDGKVRPFRLDVTTSTTQLVLGGEYRYHKLLSCGGYLGLLGRQGSGDNQLNIRTVVIDPIRLHLGGSGVGGFYIGPRGFFHAVTDDDGASATNIGVGGTLGFNMASSKSPVVVGFSISVGRALDPVYMAVAGALTVGYQIE